MKFSRPKKPFITDRGVLTRGKATLQLEKQIRDMEEVIDHLDSKKHRMSKTIKDLRGIYQWQHAELQKLEQENRDMVVKMMKLEGENRNLKENRDYWKSQAFTDSRWSKVDSSE